MVTNETTYDKPAGFGEDEVCAVVPMPSGHGIGCLARSKRWRWRYLLLEYRHQSNHLRQTVLVAHNITGQFALVIELFQQETFTVSKCHLSFSKPDFDNNGDRAVLFSLV